MPYLRLNELSSRRQPQATTGQQQSGGTASGGGTYPAGSGTPTVTATANSGYVFDSLTENGQLRATSSRR